VCGHKPTLEPARLLLQYAHLFTSVRPPGPILDLACGDGHNGVFLAQQGLPVVCCDRSQEALAGARKLASALGVAVKLWQVDLEQEGINPLGEDVYGGAVIFRFLHRPLIPCIKKSLRKGGIVVYETFTTDQAKLGKPRNPRFLLKHGELINWFERWEILHAFEGIDGSPPRAIGQLVARKP
jgi:tellurite methyltransferase